MDLTFPDLELTPKEARFVEEYPRDLNGAGAARRAGYSQRTAKSIACELLAKPHIQKALGHALVDEVVRLVPESERGRRSVYFIRNPLTGLIKIGVSSNVEDRMRGFERAAGMRFELLTVLADVDGCTEEARLHQRFASDRVIGEWFNPTNILKFLAERDHG